MVNSLNFNGIFLDEVSYFDFNEYDLYDNYKELLILTILS